MSTYRYSNKWPDNARWWLLTYCSRQVNIPQVQPVSLTEAVLRDTQKRVSLRILYPPVRGTLGLQLTFEAVLGAILMIAIFTVSSAGSHHARSSHRISPLRVWPPGLDFSYSQSCTLSSTKLSNLDSHLCLKLIYSIRRFPPNIAHLQAYLSSLFPWCHIALGALEKLSSPSMRRVTTIPIGSHLYWCSFPLAHPTFSRIAPATVQIRSVNPQSFYTLPTQL